MTSAAEQVWENEGGCPRREPDAPAPTPHTPTVRLGRIYDPATGQDGRRVLVDRLWPRGMTRARAEIDEWCKQAAPSTALRKWYRHDPRRFAEFRRRYRLELETGEQASALRHLQMLATERVLTLLTANKDPATSEAVVLAERLGRAKTS